MKYVLGFDIGVGGATVKGRKTGSFFSVFDESGNLQKAIEIPFYELTKSQAMVKRVIDTKKLFTILNKVKYNIVFACVEAQWSRPHDANPVAFSLGGSYRGVLAVLDCTGIPYKTVAPKEWKAFFGLNVGKQEAKKNTVNFVKEHFPESGVKYLYDHNKADAIMIGYYGVRVKYPRIKTEQTELFN